MDAALFQSAWAWPSRHRAVADDVVPPGGYKLSVEEGNGAIPLPDDRIEHVIGFPVENDGRVGFRFDVDFIKLRLSIADERGR